VENETFLGHGEELWNIIVYMLVLPPVLNSEPLSIRELQKKVRYPPDTSGSRGVRISEMSG